MCDRNIELFLAFLDAKTKRSTILETGLSELRDAWRLWLKLEAKTFCLVPLDTLLIAVGVRVNRQGRNKYSPVVKGLWLKPDALNQLKNVHINER